MAQSGFDQKSSLIDEARMVDSLQLVNNKALLKNLIDQGLLDKNDSQVLHVLRGDLLYDIPNILCMANNSKRGMRAMSRSKIRDVLDHNNMISENVEKLLNEEESKWLKIPEGFRYKALSLAATKDHLNSPKAKKQFIENLKLLEYGDFTDSSVENLFINGEISWEELFGGFPILDRLFGGIAENDQEFYKHISNFFTIAFDKLKIQVDISRNENFVILDDGTYTHQIDMKYLKSKETLFSNAARFSSAISSSSDRFYVGIDIKDTTVIDLDIYQKLIPFVRQISVDNNVIMKCDIYHLEKPLTFEFDFYQEQYDVIIESHPNLAIDIEGYYFQIFPEAGILDWIGTSFSFHPKIRTSEINFMGLRHHYFPGYIPSKKKKQFFKYLENNGKFLNIDEEGLKIIANKLSQNQFISAKQLLLFIPGHKLKSRTDFGKKPSYQPLFTKTKNRFKDAYPSLYLATKDNFLATDFRYDAIAHKVNFYYKGEEYSIDPGEDPMIKFINNQLNEATGKRLYNAIGDNPMTTIYVFLTQQQEKELNGIVNY